MLEDQRQTATTFITAMSAVNNHSSNAARFLQLFSSNAVASAQDVEVLDEGHGLFGELHSPREVVEALIEAATTTEENVGAPQIRRGMAVQSQTIAPTTFLNSDFESAAPSEIPLEVHNMMVAAGGDTNPAPAAALRIRWIDEHGAERPATHKWDLPSSSTVEQFAHPGHLFLLSLVRKGPTLVDEEEEQLVAAYRPKRALPSLTPHVLIVQHQQQQFVGGESPPLLLLAENILLDKFDAMAVAAHELDGQCRESASSETERGRCESTVRLLHTVLENLLAQPDEEKYHKLRLSNSKVRKYIQTSAGAMEMLRILGFHETSLPSPTTTVTSSPQRQDQEGAKEEEYLVLPTPTSEQTQYSCRQGLRLLDLVLERLAPNFVADLARPTPWQEAPADAASGKAGGGGGWTPRRGFITADDRWARADRWARLRRSGAARRPDPGQAPSSRGNWGR